MRTVYLKFTEGCCNRRILDLKALKVFFAKNGWRPVGEPKDADLICLHTCAFVKRTEDIAMAEIERMQREFPRAELLVTGCLPGINPARLREIFPGTAINTVDLTDINAALADAGYALDTLERDENLLFEQADHTQKLPSLVSIGYFLKDNFSLRPVFWRNLLRNVGNIVGAGMGLSRKHWYLRIGWGCEQPHCTFCVECRAIGYRVVSKPIEQCLKEVRAGVAAGYRELFVTADSPGAWGVDRGRRLPELLRAILDAEPSVVISNIDGIHPYFLYRYLDEFRDILRGGRIKSFMIPLQSGSDRILELMGRRYTREQFLEIVAACKRAYPRLVIVSQAIVGFPTETFEDFRESVDVLVRAGVTNVTFFPFYPHPETVAGRMDGQIDDEEKSRRVLHGLKKTGEVGILSLHRTHEVNPKYQKVKARYDQ